MISIALIATAAVAGIGPENVAVVVNGDSLDSLAVANAYAALRQIPPSNFVVLHKLSGTEFTDVEKFRSEILKPVLDTLHERGLTAQIDCIAYSVDIPYSVNVSGDVKGRKLPQVITQTAAINGLTFLGDWVLKGDIDYLRLDINNYARHLLPLPSGKELTAVEQSEYAEAMSKYDKKDYAEAIVGLEKLLVTPRRDPNIAYNLACCLALTGKSEEAIAALRKAVSAGWRNYGQTASDSDLASLRSLEGYSQVLRLIKSAHVEIQPGAAFRRSTGWNRSGEQDPTGVRYLLSTCLGVTAGRGNSVDEIIASLRRSKSADFTAPKGTIYFERNGDVRSKTREWGFDSAAAELERLGVKAVVEDGVLPKNKPDVAGAMIGIADFDWKGSQSQMLPGSIVEHLTSLGGMINKGAGQTPCTEFIRSGAGGSSGTVTEPYALQEKFPTPYIHVQYATGFTLAESFYMSLHGPYQLLIIGDPLCRPWAKKLEVKAAGLKDGMTFKGSVAIRPSVSPSDPIREFSLYVDGILARKSKPGAPLNLDAQSLCEGYHEISVVAERADLTAAQYRLKVDVYVPGSRVIESPAKVTGTIGSAIQIKLSAKGASNIELFCLGRSVGRLSGSQGVISVSASDLGPGSTLLYPVASYSSNGRASRSNGKPIAATVSP